MSRTSSVTVMAKTESLNVTSRLVYAHRPFFSWKVGDGRAVRGLDVRRAEVNVELWPNRLAQLDRSMEEVARRRVRNERGVMKALGADADDHLLALVPGELWALPENRAVERKRLIAEHDADVGVRMLDPPFDEVHRRGSDEAADERVRGPRVDLLGRRKLLQASAAHDRDPVAQRHRLDLVVCDVDRRRAQPPLEPTYLGARVDPKLRVEIRQWFVHQEDRRLAHDRAAHRNPLALPTGQGSLLAVEQIGELE
jgi:hypothetical protein